MFKIEQGPEGARKSLEAFIDGTHVTQDVAQLTVREAGHFGWLLQAFQCGAFDEGQKIIMAAIAIIDRVSEDHARAQKL